MRRIVLLSFAALLLGVGGFAAACGGGGKSSGTAATTSDDGTTEDATTSEGIGTTETIVGDSDDYKNGLAICGNLPLDLLAQQYGVKAEEKTVARAVASGAGPPSSKAYKETYAGCLAAIRGSRG